jgi:DNA topoisomerase-1
MGNTPAVCRSSYIDPRVIDKFEAGETIAGRFNAVTEAEERPQLRRHMETAVLELLQSDVATAA